MRSHDAGRQDTAPHEQRATILDDPGAWFGFEQEYFFYKDGRPLGFPSSGYPAPQGPYYTGVGYKNVGDVARKIVDEHLDLCIAAGINHEGINAEVANGMDRPRSAPNGTQSDAGGLSEEGAPSCLARPAFMQ